MNNTLPAGPTRRPDVAVLIGRFQPFHNAHLALLQHALAAAPQCVVVLGSAHQARTPKNPFTWTERAEMIRLSLPEAERSRVRFLPMRDLYDMPRWEAAVRDGVEALIAPADGGAPPAVALVGHFKDASSNYLQGFAPWTLVSVPRLPGADGTFVRDALFLSAGPEADATRVEPGDIGDIGDIGNISDISHPNKLSSLTDHVPSSTLAFLRSWQAQPCFAELAAEWHMLRKYRSAWAAAPYPPVFVTVDAVVRCAGHVLLVQRGQAPGRGLFAVPGGFIEPRETACQSALRELAEETQLELPADTLLRHLRATAVFDHPDRSLRGRTITHAYFFDMDCLDLDCVNPDPVDPGLRELPKVCAGDDAQAAAWVPVALLTAMEDRFHDDHFHMLDHFLGLTAHRTATPASTSSASSTTSITPATAAAPRLLVGARP